MTNKNQGHGWIAPRPDGLKARCGGPTVCQVCFREAAAAAKSEAVCQPAPALSLVAPLREPDWNLIGAELASLINRHGLDNYSSTPDFMLSDFVLKSLRLHREFLLQRQRWFREGTP